MPGVVTSLEEVASVARERKSTRPLIARGVLFFTIQALSPFQQRLPGVTMPNMDMLVSRRSGRQRFSQAAQILRPDANNTVAWAVDVRDEHEGDGNNKR